MGQSSEAADRAVKRKEGRARQELKRRSSEGGGRRSAPGATLGLAARRLGEGEASEAQEKDATCEREHRRWWSLGIDLPS